ncbi:MAG: DUF4258 domain-containing protein [Nanoarchaeota archaeon]
MNIVLTEHARERLKKRKITLEEVKLAINSPDSLRKEGGKYIAEKHIGRAKIEVVFEKDNYIKVITIYYIP